MGKRIRHRLRLLRLLRSIPSFRSFFLIVVVVTAVTLAFVGGETGEPVFLALAPSMGDASAPHPGATYPAGTRLARLSPDSPGEGLQVISAWTLASPAAISYDGRRVLFAGSDTRLRRLPAGQSPVAPGNIWPFSYVFFRHLQKLKFVSQVMLIRSD